MLYKFIIVFVAIAIIIVYLLDRKSSATLRGELRHLKRKHDHWVSQIEWLDKRMRELGENLNRSHDEWTEKYSELAEKYQRYATVSPAVRVVESDDRRITKNDDNLIENIFYLAELTKDKSFSFEGKANLPEDGYIYKFVIQTSSPNCASFEFVCSKSAMNKISSAKEHYINSVADEVGGVFSPEKRLITDVPGYSVLEGNKWKVDKKAKIHYE